MSGHSVDGGEFEFPYVQLGLVRDGLCERLELFDPDDEQAARRRFAELAGRGELSPAERLTRRWMAAFNARDWDGARACLTDDFRRIDYRVASPLRGEADVDATLAQARALVEQASDAWLEHEFVADLAEVGRCEGALDRAPERWRRRVRDPVCRGGPAPRRSLSPDGVVRGR